MLMVRMGYGTGILHFAPLCQPIELLWREVTMETSECWMCKTKCHSRCIDIHIEHIKIAFVNSIFVWNELQSHFDIQYCISKYYLVHPEAWGLLNFWLTSSHIFWVRNDEALSVVSAFSWRFIPDRSFLEFFIHIARLLHLAPYWSFF
jgi:hypothetical protein